MSTRCEIGLVEADGSVKVIYNHFDGYLDGVGYGLRLEFRRISKRSYYR